MTLYGVLKAIHLLSAVLWVGGMFFAYVILRPSLAVLAPPERVLLHTQVFRKFFLVVWHAMPLLILTGFIMLFGFLGGMATVPWTIHVMLLFGLVMAGVFVAIVFGPYRTFKRAADPAEKAGALDSIRKMIGVNLVLGLVTVVISVLAA
jgi:uncharacterized membrane protein